MKCLQQHSCSKLRWNCITSHHWSQKGWIFRGDIFKKGKKIDGAINNVEVIRKKKTYARKRNDFFIAGLEEDKIAAVTHHTKLELNIEEFEEVVKQGQETSVTKKKEKRNHYS